MKKLLPPFLFLIFIVSMGLICWGFGFEHFITYPYNLIGLPAVLIGLAVAQINKKYFIKSGINVNTFDKPNKLVTGGFFKYSRNPMYLGFVVALIGFAAVFQGSISSFVLVIAFFIITDRWYIRFEENEMLSEFGDLYRNYCRETRRWI